MSARQQPARSGQAAQHAALQAIVRAEGRDQGSGALPIVAVGQQEEPAFLAAIEACQRSRVELTRRGSYHGEWAELDPARLGPGPWDKSGDGRTNAATRAARWHAARPIVLRGLLSAELEDFGAEIRAAEALHEQLGQGGTLRRWVQAGLGAEPEPFEVIARPPGLFDPGRDLERVLLAAHAPTKRGRRVRDLWVKSSWLSTFDGEDSLRLRFSFGREPFDDASRDGLRQRLVHELAARLLPESALVHEQPQLAELLQACTGGPVLFTQHIAYWNAPGGGALFHHDAFAEDAELGPGQLGVCYAQLSGRTAWLALSTEDLARCVLDFGAALAEGELPWVRAQLFPSAAAWRELEEYLAEPETLLEELGRAGCGRLTGLVNRGPEFSGFLADAGHAALLEPGDVILLPNHGLQHTAMHSVFCATDERAYSLSLAIRAAREVAP